MIFSCQLGDSLCSILSIFGSVVFVDTTPKNQPMYPKKGPFQKESIIFHPLFFWRHVSFPWSKLPSLPLFAQLACVCVIFFHHQSFITGYDFIRPERIPTKRFCFFHSSLAGFSSIFLAFLGFVTALWGFKLYAVFFQVFFLWCSYSSYKQHSFI